MNKEKILLRIGVTIFVLFLSIGICSAEINGSGSEGKISKANTKALNAALSPATITGVYFGKRSNSDTSSSPWSMKIQDTTLNYNDVANTPGFAVLLINFANLNVGGNVKTDWYDNKNVLVYTSSLTIPHPGYNHYWIWYSVRFGNPSNLQPGHYHIKITTPWGTKTQDFDIITQVNKILFQSKIGNNYEIYVMDQNGNNQILLTQNKNNGYPVWSPDNKKIAFVSDRTGNWDVYVMNADGGNQIDLTRKPSDDGYPSWSPDGKKIVFASDRDSSVPSLLDIYVMNSNGSKVVRLTKNSVEDVHPAWSPDGQKIAFASESKGNREICTMNTDGTKVIDLTNNAAYDDYPAWSPDGKKIAFASDRDSKDSTKLDIYVMNADGRNVIRLTNNNVDDRHPSWSSDGKKIAFTSNRDGNNEIYTMNSDGSDVNRLTNLGDSQHPSFLRSQGK